jgi:hypothetical protein
MSFLYPVFLIGAALIAIPVVLHLLRRDVAPEVPFTAVRLLRKSPIERSRRRRLRDLLLLAARVAALLLLSAAFARPYLAGASADGSGVRVIAIDRSFSMGGPGRFARALDLARQAIDAAGSSERVAVIAFDERSDLVGAPGSAGEARASLASLQPGFGATRYGPVLAKAAETVGASAGRVVIITDLQRAGWEDEPRAVLPAGLDLEIKDVGAAPDNVAIVRVGHERDRIAARIRNSGGEARSGQVRVTLDGRPVASAPFTAAADSTVDVAIAYRPPAAGALAVSIDDPGGYAADNVRYAVLDPVPLPRVLVVTASGGSRSGFYLTRALAAASDETADGTGFEARSMTGAALSTMPAADVAGHAAIAVLATRGIDRRARETVGAFVRSGGGMLIAASPDVEPSALSLLLDWQPALAATEQAIHPAALSATDLRHPVFRPFGALAANLGQVRFERAWRVREEGWDVAARFTDGTPALLERRHGSGRIVLLATDLDRRWNDFPLHPSFVPFALETVRYVSGPKDVGREYLVARAPAEAPAEPGVHRVGDRAIAVNVDPRESATTRITEDEFRDMVEQRSETSAGAGGAREQQIEADQGYWRYALILMLAALIAESLVGKV